MPNTFEVRSFTSAGVQDKILSGARIEFTDELGAEGYVKVTMARSHATLLGISHRTEVAVFLNGDELEGSRSFLVETTGNPSAGEDAAGESADALWGGRTLHAGLRGINTYPTVFPVLTGAPQNFNFVDKTPGFILKALLDAARTRGAASDIAYTTWNSLTDSNGVGWARTLKLEYKPGTDLKSIIENMIRLGAIEFRWVGRELKVFNGETFGMDWTTGAAPICLYRGREVADSPYSESSDEVVNALLIMGDDGIMVEKVDTDSMALYGRREGTLSQGGTKDLGMLNFLGDTTLATSARLKGEYTVKILPLTSGPQPFVDYRVGDWVLYDRVAGAPPEKFRVRQISITSDGDTQSITVTLNDKFAELDLRTAKKVEGIIGGAAMEGSTPVTEADVDTLDPSPPTAVGSTSESFTNSNGSTRALAITSWAPPTTNVDGSPLTDLAGYDTEHRTTSNVSYTANTAWYPLRVDSKLQARWDRRGKDTSNNWFGADGGASVRAPDGKDWFFWSDTYWGTVGQDGKQNLNAIAHNTITISDPTTTNVLQGYASKMNKVGLDVATTSTTTGWVSNGAPALTVGDFGFNNKALRVAGANRYAAKPKAAPVRGGQPVLLMMRGRSDIATNPTFQYRFQNDAGDFVAGNVNVVPDADGWARTLVTAPATATFVQLAFLSPTGSAWADGAYFGVFWTDHEMQTWQPPLHHETITNIVKNPDGAYSTPTGAETRRNYVTNPALYTDTTYWTAYNNATVTRDTSVKHNGVPSPILPAVVGDSALNAFRTVLTQAALRTVGVGFIGDSTGESTGDPSNKDISDRSIERLQLALRKHTAVPNVPLSPKGYYGASTYIPVGYIHDGGPDWIFETADPVKFPISTLQSGFGAGGRLRNLTPGVRAHFTATFDRVRIHYGKSGFGRDMRITIDGVEQTVIHTNGPDVSGYWTSAALPLGEHTVVAEYVPVDGLPYGGGSTLLGATIWDRDYSKGVRVYDLAGSGKAAQDVASRSREMDDDFAGRQIDLLVIMLGFNDAGRDAAWGGPRSSAQFKTDIQTIISGARARGVSGPVLLVGQWQASQLTTTEPQANYRAKLSQIAASDSTVAYIDLSTAMPDTVGDTTGAYVDGLHPSTRGMARIAECIFGTIVKPSAGPASAKVVTAGTSAYAGVTISLPGAAWAAGETYMGGVWFKAAAGVAFVLRVLATGGSNGGSTTIVTGTGKWQWVESPVNTLVTGATEPPRMILRTDTGAAATFWVSEAIISQSAGPYFDGGSWGGVWTGATGVTASVQRASTPIGWTVGAGATATYESSVYEQGQGSILLSVTSALTRVVAYTGVAHALGAHASGVAVVKANFEIDKIEVTLQNGGTIRATQTSYPWPMSGIGDWNEARLNQIVTGSDTTLMMIYVYAKGRSLAPGDKVWISEVTAVTGDYFWHGGPFNGSQSGQGVDNVAWTGTPNNSSSTAEFYNSSSVLSDDQVGALFHSSAAGGNASEYLWVTGAVEIPGNKALVFCNGMRSRALRNGGGWNFQRNGEIFVAEYDLVTRKLTRWVNWFTDWDVQWGTTAVIDGSYLYVYGERGNDTVLGRRPLSNILGGAPEVFTSTGTWSTVLRNAFSIISDSNPGGVTTVRKFGTKWIAAHVAGYMDHINGFSATDPQGPWTSLGSIFNFPDNNSNKYVARFHPQMDDPREGIAISYSQSGGDVYGVQFARGPKGAASPLFTTDDLWQRHPTIEVSPDYYSPLNPGWSYQARVRSRDENGRVSTWATGAPIVLKGDTLAPPKPAAPLAKPFFRGARIEVSALTAAGGAYPSDFQRLTVHQGPSEDFAPADHNLIDTLTTRGGIAISSGLTWGVAYFWKVVAWDSTGNASEPSEAASAMSERLSDPDLPENLIDGAKHIKDESLSLKNFSVGAFGNTLVPNGNMEEYEAGAELPTGWSKGWPAGDFPDWDLAASFGIETAKPVAGSKSIKISPTAVSSRQLVSAKFPVTPGDVYYVRAKIRTSRKLDSNFIEMGLAMGDTLATVNGFGSASSVNVTAAVSDGSGVEDVVIEGQVEVPDYFGDGGGNAMRFAAFFARAGYDGNSPYTLLIDAVEVRQIVGSAAIANASINRAKIRYLAVDDARISSLGVGKLVAGELWADITVSSRIMTSKTGQRVEMNRDGLFGYNGTDTEPVTEVRADNGGLVSRYLRTNTEGTRIELGTYSTMGADSAMIAFFPATGIWQFPPAFGYGGEERRPRFPGDSSAVPGLAIHAGSKSNTLYDKHGMQMFSVDQAGGIVGVTGGKLDTSEATDGAPIRFNAGGSKGFIELLSGGANSTDPARLLLRPTSGDSYLALNRGSIRFGNFGPNDFYRMEFVSGTRWLGINHILLDVGVGAFRIAQGANPDAFVFRANNLNLNSGSLFVNGQITGNAFRGSSDTAAVLRTTDSSGALIRFDELGNPYRNSTGGTRATNSWWVDEAGLVNGGGAWGTPKIKVRAQDSYIQWNAQGDAYVDGNVVKTFVIPHPVDDEKYLVHAAVEGPTADVHYRGRGRLSAGKASVRLPDYFDTLTVPGSATVVLTPIVSRSQGPTEYLQASEVIDGGFDVFGRHGHGSEFYWLVIAERAKTAFDVEPRKSEVRVSGEGPYTYLTK